MVGIKRFIIGLVAALHTCIEINLGQSKYPKNGLNLLTRSADKIVQVKNYLLISKVSAVSRFIPDLCSAIANGWHQKVERDFWISTGTRPKSLLIL
jgi:hypothetical protein